MTADYHNREDVARTWVRPVGSLVSRLGLLIVLLLAMWTIEGVDWIVRRGNPSVMGMDIFGIHPRTTVGLRNIALAPLLHVGFGHLLANSLPFLVLGWLVIARGVRDFVVVTFLVTLISGLGVWLLGAHNSVHLGASGIVFGYLGYLLLRGFFERSVPSLLLAAIVGIFYGSMIWGVLPFQPGVSWLGHLFGFVGGGVAARLLSDPRPHPENPFLPQP